MTRITPARLTEAEATTSPALLEALRAFAVISPLLNKAERTIPTVPIRLHEFHPPAGDHATPTKRATTKRAFTCRREPWLSVR
jgi:hypothetical protein